MTLTQFSIFGESLTIVAGTGAPIALGLPLSECCGEPQLMAVTYRHDWNTVLQTTVRTVRSVETYCGYCENVCPSCETFVLGSDRGEYACERCESCENCCDCVSCGSCGEIQTWGYESLCGESCYCESCCERSCGCTRDESDTEELDDSDIAIPFTYVSLGAVFPTDGRAFGVELEIVGINPNTAARALTLAGLACSGYNGYTHEGTDKWKVVDDSSVSGGCEVVSPILRGSDGFTQLRVAMAVLVANGASVDERCGTHVHHDMSGSNGKELAAVIAFYLASQSAIDTFAMRISPDYARPNYASTITELEACSDEMVSRVCCNQGRYHAVNTQAFATYQTLEFRQHAGTVDYSQLRAWIVFGQSLITAALRGIRGSASVPAVLGALLAFGLDHESHAQLSETSRRERATNVRRRF